MYTLTLLLIIIPDLPEDVKFPTAEPILYQALKDQAELLELYRAAGNWNATSEGFDRELRWVRNHYRCRQDAPPLADRCWLPSREFCVEACKFADEVIEQLVFRQLSGGELTAVEACLEETRRLRMVWEYASKAQAKDADLSSQRRYLQLVRLAIGPDAYRAGRMPPWVAVRWFQEMTPGGN